MGRVLTLRETRQTVLDEQGLRVWDDLDAENKGTEADRLEVLRARFAYARQLEAVSHG